MSNKAFQEYTSILLELQYLPPIQYFSKFFRYQKVIIEQHENFLKGSYRNRCHIAGPNGLQRLSIPLKKGKNEQQSIRAVRISYDESWPSKHWNSIKTAYGNAPYFEFYGDELKSIYQKQYELLFDFNWDLLQFILQNLETESTLELSNSYIKAPLPPIIDGRNCIFPKKHRQKEDKHFKILKYAQVFEEKHGFMPNLSILDLLFCYGPQASLFLESSISI